MKQAHWDVKEPTFFQLHELCDKTNEDAEDYVDLVAERPRSGSVERARQLR